MDKEKDGSIVKSHMNPSDPRSGRTLEPHSNQRRNLILSILACIILPAIVYFNALNTPFVLDDLMAVVKNPDVKKLSNIKTRLIFRREDKVYEGMNRPFRPLTYLTFTLNYHFSKLKTTGYHVVNLALHILVTLLIFVLTRKILYHYFGVDTLLLPLLTALFFSVHPMNVDVVTHVVHRKNSLPALFFLLSAYFFFKCVETSRGYLVLSLISFFLAYASKQIAVMLPLSVLLLDYMILSNCNFEKLKERRWIHFTYWVSLIIVLAATYIYFGELGDHAPDEEGTIWTRTNYFLTQPYVILKYLQLLFVPVGQCIDHAVKAVTSVSDPRWFMPVLFWTGFSALVVTVCRKVPSLSKLILFSLIWFFITLLPASSIVPINNDPMAEKRIYLGGLGYSLGFVCLYLMAFGIFSVGLKGMSDRFAEKKKRNTKEISQGQFPLAMLEHSNVKRVFLSLFCLHLLLLSVATWKRNQVYQSPARLWEEVLELYPHSVRGHTNLGFHYSENRQYLKARRVLERAVAMKNPHSIVYSNLGNIYGELGEFDNAIRILQRGAVMSPNDSTMYNNLGVIYGKMKDYGNAYKYFSRALDLKPDFGEARKNLNIILQEGTVQNVPQRKSESDDPKENNNLGNFYARQKKYETAIRYYEKALELDPKYAVALYNLGNVHRDRKKVEQAIQYYREAIKLNPKYALAYYNLGKIYMDLKKYDLSMMELKQAKKLVPNNRVVQKEIDKLQRLMRNR